RRFTPPGLAIGLGLGDRAALVQRGGPRAFLLGEVPVAARRVEVGLGLARRQRRGADVQRDDRLASLDVLAALGEHGDHAALRVGGDLGALVGGKLAGQRQKIRGGRLGGKDQRYVDRRRDRFGGQLDLRSGACGDGQEQGGEQ